MASEQYNKLLDKLIILLLEKFNVYIIYELYAQNPTLLQAIIKDYDSKSKRILEKIFTTTDKSQRLNCSILSSEFVNGFGKITYQGMLLTCAQIQSRKNYEFNPLILNSNEEFKELIDFLSNLQISALPLTVHFILLGDHTISGVMRVNKERHVECLFIDSLGLNGRNIHTDTQFRALRDSMNYLVKHFPNYTFYMSKNKRQNSLQGCTVFALDDVMHLFTINRYLPIDRIEPGILGYCRPQAYNGQALMVEQDHIIKIYPVELPLSLERTMQSKRLINNIIPERKPLTSDDDDKPYIVDDERLLHVNKKQQTAETSVIFSMKPSPTDEHAMNMRLVEKLNKMAEHNLNYLLLTNSQYYEKAIYPFTIAGYKERILNILNVKAKTLLSNEDFKDPTSLAQALIRFETELPIDSHANELYRDLSYQITEYLYSLEPIEALPLIEAALYSNLFMSNLSTNNTVYFDQSPQQRGRSILLICAQEIQKRNPEFLFVVEDFRDHKVFAQKLMTLEEKISMHPQAHAIYHNLARQIVMHLSRLEPADALSLVEVAIYSNLFMHEKAPRNNQFFSHYLTQKSRDILLAFEQQLEMTVRNCKPKPSNFSE